MTSKQELNSPAVTKLTSSGIVRPRIVSEEVLEVLDQKPVKTVWGQSQGRPILDRLPAVEEQYQKGYDEDQAYVYIDPQLGKYDGPGSMQPRVKAGNPAVITVESGIATWKMGQVETPASSFNVLEYEKYGLRDGKYKIGFILSFEVPESDTPIEGHSLATVSNESLAEAAVAIAANREVEQHEDYKAISTATLNSSWWPSYDQDAKDYCAGSWLALDFRAPVTAQSFGLLSDRTHLPSSYVSAFYSDDGAVWSKANETLPGQDGWFVDVSAHADEAHRYWRFFFWGGDASVTDIQYTGSAYYPDLRLTRPRQLATLHVENLYDDPPENFMMIANFTVRNWEINKVADFRSFTSRKYEPLASWLTTFQDIALRGTFTAIENYEKLYLNPLTADYHFYRELDNSEWMGVGEFNVDGDETTYAPPEYIDAVEDLSPNQVICLQYPEDHSDLATKFYTDIQFENLTIDNGLYY